MDPPTEATFVVTDEVRAVAERAADRGLCRECFGRLVGRWGHGLSNAERAARLEATIGRRVVEPATCGLCRGQFARLDLWVDRVRAAGDGYEWHRFSCGSRWEPEILALEETLWSETGSAWGESARGAFNRELGKRVEAATGALGGPDRPEMVFVADLPMGRVECTVLPLYVRGRYRKLDRTIPQTRWPCRHCAGRGCDRCGGTGKMYAESVEELVAGPFLEATGGRGSRFHGMGREDIDARMLGRGRPFVLEVLSPRSRSVDVTGLAAEVAERCGHRVELVDVVPAGPADVVRVKEAAPEKTYEVVVEGEAPLAKINEALAFVAGRAIAQRTPTRVAHRRSDRVRARRIVAARLVTAEAGRFTLDLRAEAGTYIKEWVEGDGGRTDPNLAALLGTPLRVAALDVLEIHDAEGS
jgi:tRNA pseudouridine synthase 10